MVEYGIAGLVTPLLPGKYRPRDLEKVASSYREVREALHRKGVTLGPLELVIAPTSLGWRAVSDERE
ncbi:MAG TPA: hypothetical protein VFM86_03915 [Pedococcus sp.]|nr:hypothetical protein [Pedococcus sp.]